MHMCCFLDPKRLYISTYGGGFHIYKIKTSMLKDFKDLDEDDN